MLIAYPLQAVVPFVLPSRIAWDCPEGQFSWFKGINGFCKRTKNTPSYVGSGNSITYFDRAWLHGRHGLNHLLLLTHVSFVGVEYLGSLIDVGRLSKCK